MIFLMGWGKAGSKEKRGLPALKQPCRYRIISSYTVFRQDRALLKVGRCPESEMGPFDAPDGHSSRGVGFRCLQQCG